MEIPVFSRKTPVFGVLLEYTFEYWKFERAIEWSSSGYIWDRAETLGTPF